MDPNPTNFPILSYIMAKLPSIKRSFSSATASAEEFDVENPPALPPKPQEPHFELTEKMPHLKNPKLIAAMRGAVAEVAQTRSVLQTLGTRPDHETVDTARFKIADIQAQSSTDSMEADEDYKIYKAVISLDEMHEAYERMLSEAETRLEKIYEAAVAGDEFVEEEGKNEGMGSEEEEMNEEVQGILKEAESGKVFDRIDLPGRKLRILPEAFGRLKSLVVLNFSNNQLQAIPDSISVLENLEVLNLASNLLALLPDSIGLLFKLKILDVSRNKLLTLPDSIAQCRSLVELDLSFNKLTYLPTAMGFELMNLQRLSVQLNKLRSLPTSIGELKSLRILDVHFNELHSLPHSIGGLTNLEILDVSSNFSDLKEVPDTISDLSNLKELDLSNNQIHSLPDSFPRLLNLTKLNVDQNPLTIPPKEVVAGGVGAVRVYMAKRMAEMLKEEEQKNMHSAIDPTQAGLLTRSTSWLSNVVSNVSGTISGYVGGGGKSSADSYLDQQL